VTRFEGRALDWRTENDVVEVALHRAPANEIGTEMLAELEQLADALPDFERGAAAILFHSLRPAGFSAGADLRELHARIAPLSREARVAGVRDFLRRVHRVLDALDETPLPTIAALHGVVLGGGLELALVCDVRVADRLARFGFPELRLGLVPGFGGVARLERDVGGALVRDLLLTGRTINAARAHAAGLVSQVVAEGQALGAARSAAAQVAKLDRTATAAAKRLAKRVPREQLAGEIDVFCELFARDEVEAALDRFVRDEGPLPYLP
jgi:enoyl-CoA hydratase